MERRKLLKKPTLANFRIKEKMMRSPSTANRHADAPSFTEFRTSIQYPHIDVSEYMEAHRLVDTFRGKGKHNYPSSKQEGTDQEHTKIKNDFEEKATESVNVLSDRLQNILDKITSVSDDDGLKYLKRNAQSVYEDTKSKIDNFSEQSKAELNPILEKYRNIKTFLIDFMKDSSLGTRIADYSKNQECWMFIAAIFLVECVVNAFALQDVVPSGLAGALAMTVVITAINVFFGILFIGEGWRSTNSVNKTIRVRGYTQIGVFSLFLIFFNLVVGHLRDVMKGSGSTIPLNGGGEIESLVDFSGGVWESFLASPVGFNEPETFLLVIAGILSFVLASWKGYERDDPYPGYGKISKSFERAMKAYTKAREEHIEGLTEILETGLEELNRIEKEANVKREEYDRDVNLGLSEIRKFPGHINKLEKDMQLAIQMIRDANMEEREAPPPKYFGNINIFPKDAFKAPEFSPPKKPKVGDLVSDLTSKLHEHYRRILSTNYPKN